MPTPLSRSKLSLSRASSLTTSLCAIVAALLLSAIVSAAPAEADHGHDDGEGGHDANPFQVGDVDGFTISTTFTPDAGFPTTVREASDGALFVTYKNGDIEVFEPDGSAAAPVGTVPAYVNGSLGLLGFDLHPNFPVTPLGYATVSTSTSPPVRTGQLLKLTFSEDGRTLTGTDVLVDNWCGTYDFHGPNHVEFGPDGALYVSSGDFFDWQDSPTLTDCGDPTGLAGGFRSQDYQDSPADGVGDPLGLNGTIARFELTASGDIAATTDIAHEQVIAFGLRDPIRFTFRSSGTIFFGDDGIYTREVNSLANPAHPNVSGQPVNYGWPCYEGGGLRHPEAGKYADLANLGPCLDDGSSPQLDLSDDINGLPEFSYSGHGNRVAAISFLPDDTEVYGSWANALLYAETGQEILWAVPHKGGDDYFWESAEIIARNIKVEHIEASDDGHIHLTGQLRTEADELVPHVGDLHYDAPPEKPGRFTLDDPWDLTDDAGQPIPAPTAFEYAPTAGDNRIFVSTKTGQIWAYDNWGDPTGKLVVDLANLLDEGGQPIAFGDVGDAGLLSIALHPNFEVEPWIYVLYTSGGGTGGAGGSGRLARFNYDDAADPATVTLDELIGENEAASAALGEPHYFWCLATTAHPITDLNFAPDGTLYVVAGEGASAEAPDDGSLPAEFYSFDCNDPAGEGGAFRSQDMQTTDDPLGYNGALIRINPDGSIPADNPMVSATPSYPDDDPIIAYGLRTPWRFAIHPYTSEIFISQVGWDTSESIFHIEDPLDATVENFGWPCYEGDQVQPRFAELNNPLCDNLYADDGALWTPPLLPYSLPGGQSASGLRVYFGGAGYPQEYEGALFFSDFAGNLIRAIPPGEDGQSFDTTDVRDIIVDEPIVPIDMKVGRDGAVTFLDIFAATLNRVVYTQSPSVRLEASATSGAVGTTFDFTATSLFDTEGVDVVTWDLDRDGDYSDATGPTVSITPSEKGSYTVRAIATDPSGGIGSAELTFTVGNTPPQIDFVQPVVGDTATLDDEIYFEVTAVDADSEGNVTPLDSADVDVEFVLNHCTVVENVDGDGEQNGDSAEEDCHEHYVADVSGATSGTFTPAPHSLPSRWVLRATGQEPDRSDWALIDYDQRRRVTFDADLWSGDTENFVAPIIVDGASVDVLEQAALVDEEGLELPVLPETAGQQTTIWARFPAEVAGKTFTLYFDRNTPAECGSDCGAQDIYEGVTGLNAVIDGYEIGDDGLVGQRTTSDAFDRETADSEHWNLPGLTPSPWGYAMSFDAAEQNMLPSGIQQSQLDGTTGLTWSVWVWPAAVASFLEGVDAIVATDNGGFDWGILRAGEYWSVFNGASQDVFNEANATTLPVLWEEWQMLTLTVDPSTDEMMFYLNDTSATIPLTADNYTEFSAAAIVGNAAGTFPDGAPWEMWFTGDMDNVRFYDRPLSNVEVTNLYRSYQPVETDVAGYQIAGLVDVGPAEQPSGLRTTVDHVVEPVVDTIDVVADDATGGVDPVVSISAFSESYDTPFELTTMKGTDLSLNAPASGGGQPFDHWLVSYGDGSTVMTEGQTLFLNTRDDITTVAAVYGEQVVNDPVDPVEEEEPSNPTEEEEPTNPVDEEPTDDPSEPVGTCVAPTTADNQLEPQVKRLYRAFFLRDPGAQGLRYWMRVRASGMSVAEIASQFAASAEFQNRYGSLSNGAYVGLVYQNVLGRTPAPGGLRYWQAVLQTGTSRGDVMTFFSESTENIRATGGEEVRETVESSVYRLYVAIFGRAPGDNGLQHWTELHRSGISLQLIAEIMVVSEEFTRKYGRLDDRQFVTQVYCNVFGREPQVSSLDYWSTRLRLGTSRGALMAVFSESPEFIVNTNTLP